MNWMIAPDPSVVRSRKALDWSRSIILRQTAVNPVSPYTYESAADARYVLTFKCEIDKWIEFYYRYQDDNNRYALQQDSDTGDLYVIKRVAGSPTILFLSPAFFVDTEDYEVVIEAHGQNHLYFVNGALVFARTDPMLPSEPGLKFYHNYTDITLRVYS